jgi:hypothetical protein
MKSGRFDSQNISLDIYHSHLHPTGLEPATM